MEFGAAFWVGVSFVLFVAVIIRPLGKIITQGLDGRAARIQAELEEAERLRIQAEKLLADYQAKHRDLTTEANAILTHAEEEASRRMQQAQKEIEELVQKKINLAADRLAGYEAAALEAIRTQALDVAIQTVHTLLKDQSNKQWTEEFTARAIKDIEKKLN